MEIKCSVGCCDTKTACIFKCNNDHYIHELCLKKWTYICKEQRNKVTCPTCRNTNFVLWFNPIVLKNNNFEELLFRSLHPTDGVYSNGKFEPSMFTGNIEYTECEWPY